MFSFRETTPLRKLLMLKAMTGSESLVEATATPGNPCTFETDVAKALKQCKVNFAPVQSGTGDPSPENVRPITGWTGVNTTHCGKNLLNPNSAEYYNYTISSTGEYITSTNDRICTGYISCDAGITLTAHGEVKWSGGGYAFSFAGIAAFTKDKVYISREIVNNKDSLSMTTPSGTAYIRFCLQYNNHEDPTPSIFESLKMQLEVGTETPYEPYSGTTYPVTFPALGKNLFDLANEFSARPGTYSISGDTLTVKQADVSGWGGISTFKLPAGTYTFSRTDASGKVTARTSIDNFNSDFFVISDGTTTRTFTLSEEAEIKMKVGNGASTFPFDTKIQIESGSTATAYEPFTNTAYGGTLDLTSGVLTVTKGVVVLTGQENFILHATSTDNAVFFIRGSAPLDEKDQICTHFTFNRNANGANNAMPNTFVQGTSGNLFIQVKKTTASNDTEFNEWLASQYNNGTPIKYCYNLKIPFVYQLTPTQITTMIGDNVLWSDANGNLEVKYMKKG